MKYLAYLLIPLVVHGLLSFLSKRGQQQYYTNLEKRDVVVYLPNFVGWIGLVDTFLFLFGVLLPFVFPDLIVGSWIPFTILGIIFIPLGLWLIGLGFFWKILIPHDQDYMVYTSIFAHTQKIYYKDIKYYKLRGFACSMKVGRKKYIIEPMATNMKHLLKAFKKYGVKAI